MDDTITDIDEMIKKNAEEMNSDEEEKIEYFKTNSSELPTTLKSSDWITYEGYGCTWICDIITKYKDGFMFIHPR